MPKIQISKEMPGHREKWGHNKKWGSCGMIMNGESQSEIGRYGHKSRSMARNRGSLREMGGAVEIMDLVKPWRDIVRNQGDIQKDVGHSHRWRCTDCNMWEWRNVGGIAIERV